MIILSQYKMNGGIELMDIMLLVIILLIIVAIKTK